MATQTKTQNAQSTSKHVKRIPSFHRQNYILKARVGDAWRKPRGIDNKQRIQKKGTGALPRIGYRVPVATRGLHPSGAEETLVHNPGQLSKLDKKIAVRIGGGVGGKKRAVIVKKAKEMGLAVLN